MRPGHRAEQGRLPEPSAEGRERIRFLEEPIEGLACEKAERQQGWQGAEGVQRAGSNKMREPRGCAGSPEPYR